MVAIFIVKKNWQYQNWSYFRIRLLSAIGAANKRIP